MSTNPSTLAGPTSTPLVETTTSQASSSVRPTLSPSLNAYFESHEYPNQIDSSSDDSSTYEEDIRGLSNRSGKTVILPKRPSFAWPKGHWHSAYDSIVHYLETEFKAREKALCSEELHLQEAFDVKYEEVLSEVKRELREIYPEGEDRCEDGRGRRMVREREVVERFKKQLATARQR